MMIDRKDLSEAVAPAASRKQERRKRIAQTPFDNLVAVESISLSLEGSRDSKSTIVAIAVPEETRERFLPPAKRRRGVYGRK